MAVRMASVDKLTFLTCIKHNLWGANNTYIDKWNIGDTLIFKVGDCLVATAKITGQSYMDDAVVWKNGLFWNRIPLEFEVILDWNECIPFNGEVRDMFLNEWGIKYGWVILNKHPLKEDVSNYISDKFKAASNKAAYYKQHIDSMLIEEESL